MLKRTGKQEILPSSVLSLTSSLEIADISEPPDDDDSDSDSSDEEVMRKAKSPVNKGPNSANLLSRGAMTRACLLSEKEALEETTVDDVVQSVQLKRGNSFTLTSVPMERIDPRILQCTWITRLTLHDNGLNQLPESISVLRNLACLKVTNNHLTTLPAAIGLLTALETLDIGHNEVDRLPHEVGCLIKLRTCILDFNKVDHFPSPLFELPDLASLSLMENFDIRTFAPTERFRVFKKLKLQIDNVPKLCEEWQAMEMPNITLEWHKVYPDQVLDWLFIGSLRTAQEQRVYDDLNITRVVTCGTGMSITLGDGMDQLLLALADTVDAKLSGHLQRGIDYIADAKAKHEKVLVHCFAGLSRSASLVCAYLMRENRWTYAQSLDFVRAARPNVCPNEGFVRQLIAYEQDLGITP